MKHVVWLIVGFALGLGGMWLYSSQVREPRLIAETTQAVKASVQEEELSQSTTLTGKIISFEEDAENEDIGTFALQAAGAENASIAISFDANTKFYRLSNEAVEGRELISESLISVGDTVTIISNTPVAGQKTIYATEVVRL